MHTDDNISFRGCLLAHVNTIQVSIYKLDVGKLIHDNLGTIWVANAEFVVVLWMAVVHHGGSSATNVACLQCQIGLPVYLNIFLPVNPVLCILFRIPLKASMVDMM